VKVFTSALLATLFIVGTASAQYDTSGLYLRPHLSAVSWNLDELSDDDAESGFGGGLTIGYGFNEMFSVFLDASGASISPDDEDSYILAHADLGVQATFGQDKFQPYAVVALNGRSALLDTELGEVSISGAGLTFGGGVLLFLSEKLALDAGARYTTGSLDEIEIDGVTIQLSDFLTEDITATSLRFNVGFSYFF
jgi:opacity protein-like surface antigen